MGMHICCLIVSELGPIGTTVVVVSPAVAVLVKRILR
jgi:hypothetical protein